MRVVILCDGRTEAALRDGLREFVNRRTAPGKNIGIQTRSLDGTVLRKKLASLVRNYLDEPETAGVIALTDVLPAYQDANDAKSKLKQCAGESASCDRFQAHAAQFEVEAWLMPFWDELKRYLKVEAASPGAQPERINHAKPPSVRLKELYGRARQKYDKVVDARRWLTADRLEQAAALCPELKLFLNSILRFAGAEALT